MKQDFKQGQTMPVPMAIAGMKAMSNVDFPLLYHQRAELTLCLSRESEINIRELYEGILNLMDGILNDAEDAGLFDLQLLIEHLWTEFEDVSMDEDLDATGIDWCGWPAGTPKKEILQWFDAQYNLGVATLQKK